MKKLYSLLIIFDLLIVLTIRIPHFNMFNSRVFIDQTGSMMPSIRPGSVIFTKYTNMYKNGDIITFPGDPNPITHRIFKTINRNGYDFFVTKGDANDALDNTLVDSRKIIGKVVLIIPYLGILINFLKTKIGLYLFIFLPTLSIIVIEIKKIFNELK